MPRERHDALFDGLERATLAYADLVTTRPGDVDETDLTALQPFFDDTQIVELNLVISYANLTNRIADGLLADRTTTPPAVPLRREGTT